MNATQRLEVAVRRRDEIHDLRRTLSLVIAAVDRLEQETYQDAETAKEALAMERGAALSARRWPLAVSR